MADNFRFGSWATSDYSKVVVLYAFINGGSTGTTFIRQDEQDHNGKGIEDVAYPVTGWGAGAHGYQVPTGKEYVCTQVRWGWTSGVTYGSIGYADNDPGVNQAFGNFTNPKSKWGINHTTYAYAGGTQSGEGRNGAKEHGWRADTFFRIPALKYPFWACNASIGCWMYGFEE